MNPYILIAALLGFLGSGFVGYKVGIDAEQAAQAREQKHVTEAVDAANKSAAQAIAALSPIYTTIQNEVQREIRTNTVYSDCRLPADGLRLVQQALNGGAVPSSDSKLSEEAATTGR